MLGSDSRPGAFAYSAVVRRPDQHVLGRIGAASASSSRRTLISFWKFATEEGVVVFRHKQRLRLRGGQRSSCREWRNGGGGDSAFDCTHERCPAAECMARRGGIPFHGFEVRCIELKSSFGEGTGIPFCELLAHAHPIQCPDFALHFHRERGGSACGFAERHRSHGNA